MDQICDTSLERIIQESVPGKQITIAHVIAAPGVDLYSRLGLEPREAVGILTLTPSETAIIATDIATKAAKVEIGFLDRFTGSLTITGDVQSVEVALQTVVEVFGRELGFATVKVTRT